uniref:Uncharacterized protein n=1 Tax=Pygocentrus nattereri TaxID=42514 RepID=A0AAR2LYE5_PYGNA
MRQGPVGCCTNLMNRNALKQGPRCSCSLRKTAYQGVLSHCCAIEAHMAGGLQRVWSLTNQNGRLLPTCTRS